MTGSVNRADNQPGRPARPTDVRPDRLEQALRDSLSRQVDLPLRETADLAGTAIRRANGMHRRRTVAGLGLAAVATVLVSTGMAQLAEPNPRYQGPSVVFGDPSPLVSSAPAPAPTGRSEDRPLVDLVVGTTLITTGGTTVDLAAIGPVERALRTAEGLLLVGAPTVSGRTLWSVGADGAERVVLAGVGQVVFSADGRQVAWREGGELRAAGIINAKVIASVRTPLPEGAEPERFVGDAVLVRRTTASGAPVGYALWQPAAGRFQPQWRTNLIAVYGTLPDGRLIGQVKAIAGTRCLAVVDPAAGLAPVVTGCGYALGADGRGTVSPDGRWLVVNGRLGRSSASAETALLIDLSRAFEPTPAVRPAGARLLGEAEWIGSSTLLHVDQDGKLVQLRATGAVGGQVPTVRTEIPAAKPGWQTIVVSGTAPSPSPEGASRSASPKGG